MDRAGGEAEVRDRDVGVDFEVHEFRIDLVLACSGEHGTRGEHIRRVRSEIAAELESVPAATSKEPLLCPASPIAKVPLSTERVPVLSKVIASSTTVPVPSSTVIVPAFVSVPGCREQVGAELKLTAPPERLSNVPGPAMLPPVLKAVAPAFSSVAPEAMLKSPAMVPPEVSSAVPA